MYLDIAMRLCLSPKTVKLIWLYPSVRCTNWKIKTFLKIKKIVKSNDFNKIKNVSPVKKSIYDFDSINMSYQCGIYLGINYVHPN